MILPTVAREFPSFRYQVSKLDKNLKFVSFKGLSDEDEKIEELLRRFQDQNPTKVSVTSAIKGNDITQQNVKNPTKGIDYNVLHSSAFSNLNANKYVNNNTFDSDRFVKNIQTKNVDSNISATFLNVTNNTEFKPDNYIQNVLSTNVQTNSGAPYVQLTSIDDIIDMSDVKVKDKLNINYITNISGLEKNNFEHDNIELDRNIPLHKATTNVNQSSIYKRTDYDNQIQLERNTPLTAFKSNKGNNATSIIDTISDNDYKLTPKITPGSFSMPPLKPMVNRMQQVNENYSNEKSSLNKKISQNFARY